MACYWLCETCRRMGRRVIFLPQEFGGHADNVCACEGRGYVRMVPIGDGMDPRDACKHYERREP